jgi:hypothetical protein
MIQKKKKAPAKKKKKAPAKKSQQLNLAPANVDYIKNESAQFTKQFLVRAPKELIAVVDQIFKYNGFTSRNEFVVHCIKIEANRISKRME